MENNIYDIIIIGGGPAGYSAALYASRAGFSTLVIEKAAAGGQMALTGEIENYPGFDEGVDGFTLGMRMKTGAEKYGAVSKSGNILSVDLSGEVKKVSTKRADFYGRCVIVATGAEARNLGIDGEDELVGRGLHYCAHCDGNFYKDKTVIVVGGGNSAVGDALYLSRICKKVYLVHRRDELRAAKIYHGKLEERENIEPVLDSVVESFDVDEKIVGANIKNVKTGSLARIACDGVFVSIGRRPATDIFRGVLALDENGYIVADETTRTSVAGVFAAGDVRTKALRQVVTAAADGALAVHFAEEYLG